MSRCRVRLHGLACGLLLSAAVGDRSTDPATAAPSRDHRHLSDGGCTGSAEELMARIDRAQRDLRTCPLTSCSCRVKLFRQELARKDGWSTTRWGPDDGCDAGALALGVSEARSSTVLLIGERATMRMGTLPPQVFDTGKDPAARHLCAARLWLGQGELASARDQYDISLGASPASRPSSWHRGQSSPLAATFARIELQVDGTNLALLRLLLVERSGDERDPLREDPAQPTLDTRLFAE